MAVDKKRLNEYIKELKALEKEVGEVPFIDIFEKKVLNALANGRLDENDIEFLRNEIERLFLSDFARFDTKILQTYNEVLAMANELYDDLGGELTRDFEKLRALEGVHRIQLGDYKDATVEGVARAIKRGIVEDYHPDDIRREIKRISNKADFYAKTITNTQLNTYGQEVKWQKALISGTSIFFYLGSESDNTRDFCLACLGLKFHINDIMKLNNRNLMPVYRHRGGWNCVHHWEPDPFEKEASPESKDVLAVWR